MPIFKTSSSAWGTWSSSPTATQDGEVGTAASPTTNFTGSAQITLASLAITPQYTPASLDVSVTGGVSTQITSRGVGYAGHSVYIADGKTFSMGALEFNHSVVPSHSVYVGAGATLIGGMRSATNNTNTVTKAGPGNWTAGFGQTSTVSQLIIDGGAVISSAVSGGNFAVAGTITINNNSTFSLTGNRTYSNPIAIGSTGGQIDVATGITSPFSGAFSGSGTLTKLGSGTLSITTSNLSMPLNISAGAVTMAAGLSVTSGVSGTGTLNLTATGTLTGNVTGTPTITGNYIRTAVGSVSDSGNSSGYPNIPDSGGAGTLTISGTWTGNLDTIYSSLANKKTVIVTGQLQGTSFPNAALRLGTQATLTQSGAAAQITGPVSLGFDAGFGVAAGATANATLTTVTGGGYNDHYLTADANASNSYSGNIASGSTTGTMYVDVASGGTLSLTGANQTWSTGATARKFIKRQAGTLKVTGKLTVNTAPFEVSAGKLEINSTSQAAFNAGLSMGASTTLACASSGAYAAQIAGAVTLAAGATMKFGSA